MLYMLQYPTQNRPFPSHPTFSILSLTNYTLNTIYSPQECLTSREPKINKIGYTIAMP